MDPEFTLRINGWTDQESAPFLAFLVQLAIHPEHVFRLQWAPGTLAIWDNRAAWLQAINDYHGHRRLMLEGCAREAVA